MTNNSRRKPDQTNAANSESPNNHDHIIRIENAEDHFSI